MAKRALWGIGSLTVSAVIVSPLISALKAQSYTNLDVDQRDKNVTVAINQARKLIMRLKNETGCPGIIVGVSVNGDVVWKEGIGYADLENEVPAHEDTVVRIASISKSLTAAVVGRLWQEGKIDIDAPVQKYIATFPEKTFENKKVNITTRQLMCHLSGIRHYSKKKKDDNASSDDGQLEEFYSKERYENVEKALSIFKDDDLMHSPGSKFLYTTYGWTVVSAVMEGATGKTYPQLMRAFLRQIGMRRTYLDEHEPIIYGRSKYYTKNKNGKIINSPYVDNSCKWAGGGFLSTVGDLLKFCNAMLFAYQNKSEAELGGESQIINNGRGNLTEAKQEEILVKSSANKETQELSEKIQKDKVIKQSSEKIASVMHKETAEKIPENMTKEKDSVIGLGVSSFMYGIAAGGSYAWRKATSLFKSKDDSKVENKENNAESDSLVRSGLNSIKEGVGAGGSYAWEIATSLFRSKDDNKVQNKENNAESDSLVRSGLNSIKEGVGAGGSYAWEMATSLFRSKDDNKVQNKENNAESGSLVRTGLKSIKEGVGDGGSYAWEMATSLFRSKDDNKVQNKENSVESDSLVHSRSESIKQGIGAGDSDASRSNDETKVQNKENSAENDSLVRSGLNSIKQGVGAGGSYAWEMATSLFRSMDDSKDENKENNAESDSLVRSGLNSIKQGVGTGGSYAWEMATSLFRSMDGSKDENKENSAESDSLVRTGLNSIKEGVGAGGSYAWNMATSLFRSKDDSKVENKENSAENDSLVRSGLNSIKHGVGAGGSYAWNMATSLFWGKGEEAQNKESNAYSKSKENNKIESTGKENSLQAQSYVSRTLSNVNSSASYLWKKLTFNSDQKDADSPKENSDSPIEAIKNLFKPRALEITEETKSLVFIDTVPKNKKREDVWHNAILPYSVRIVLGQNKIKNVRYVRKSNLNENNKPFIESKTMKSLWTRVEGTRLADWGPHVEGGYGLGFGVAESQDSAGGVPDGGQPFIVGHTGGAVGASSAMVIVPRKSDKEKPPEGVAVVLLTNLQSVSLNHLAIEIARIFANVVV